MKNRSAFTMLELIFVIVIMGILAKFGVEFLFQAYNSFIHSSINNTLQAQSGTAVESVAARLQYRIKDSVIGRKSSDNTFLPIGSASGNEYNILEWVGSDIENFRGTSSPNWSGIIDLDASSATSLISPETNTTALNTLIATLSAGGASTSGINNAAIYFVGSDSDINNYGWAIPSAGAFTTQNGVMHPIKTGASLNELVPKNASTGVTNSFAGVDVYEYYQLAWTAYAVGIDDYNASTNTGTLKLWYDYQPWEGETYLNGDSETLMENVSTFQFKSLGSILKIQVCVNSDLVEDYSLCKEKTIY